MSPLLQTAKDKIFSVWSIMTILIISGCYITLAALLLNYRLVIDTLIGNTPIMYKVTLLYLLVIGIFPSLGPLDSILLACIGLLFGLNMLLIFKTITKLEGMGKIKVSVGGIALISLVTVGCGACGFTIFSLLGISASLSFLPFHGLEVHILSLGVLLFSSWYLIKKLTQANVCDLI